MPDTAEWRVLAAAARFVRAFEKDADVAPPLVQERAVAMLANALVALGSIASARAFLASHGGALPPVGGAVALARLVRCAPPTPDGQPENEFADDPAADMQIVRRPGARSVLFVFAGGANGYNGPLRLAHQWFRRLDVHVVYLRDFDGMFYAGGIGSLGNTRTRAIAALSEIAAGLGAERTLCTGSSSGSFGALLYALDLQADAVLCLAGATRLDESAERVLARHRTLRPGAEPMDRAAFDLPALYAGAGGRTRVRIVFGEKNERDSLEAANMRGIDGVELHSVPDATRHGILQSLVPRNDFARHLDWLVGAVPRAGRSTSMQTTST